MKHEKNRERTTPHALQIIHPVCLSAVIVLDVLSPPRSADLVVNAICPSCGRYVTLQLHGVITRQTRTSVKH